MRIGVSVVIPLYNKERHIARAIESALNQTYCDFELIIVDDGSTDGGARVVEAIRDPRVRLITQANAGVSMARNRGIAAARADLIAFLDADDEWLPGFLETILRLARRHPECGAYATAYADSFKEGDRVTHKLDGIPGPPWEGIIPNYFRAATSYPLWSSAVAVPRRVFGSAGLFPDGVIIGEDLDMWCRIAMRYPISLSTQVGAVYHREADNRVSISNRVLGEYSFVRVIQDALRSDAMPPELRRDAFEYMAAHQIDIASRNAMAGKPRCARPLLWSCRGTRKYAGYWWITMLLSTLPPGWPARLKAVKDAMRNLAGCRR